MVYIYIYIYIYDHAYGSSWPPLSTGDRPPHLRDGDVSNAARGRVDRLVAAPGPDTSCICVRSDKGKLRACVCGGRPEPINSRPRAAATLTPCALNPGTEGAYKEMVRRVRHHGAEASVGRVIANACLVATSPDQFNCAAQNPYCVACVQVAGELESQGCDLACGLIPPPGNGICGWILSLTGLCALPLPATFRSPHYRMHVPPNPRARAVAPPAHARH